MIKKNMKINTLSIKIEKTKNKTRYIWTLFLKNIIFSFTFFPNRYWISMMASVDIRTLTNIGCKVHIFLVYSVMQLSAWVIVLVTLERFVAVLFPFKSKQLFTRRRTYISFVVVCCSLITLNLHHFWTYHLQTFKYGKYIYRFCVPSNKE